MPYRVDRDRRELPVGAELAESVTVEVHRATRARGAAVLLTHGAGKDLDAPHLVALADAIAATGRLVVRVNQPWKQAGRAVPPRPPKLVPDYLTVLATVRATFGPRRDWVTGGHSNGARLTTHALAGRDVDGVVGALLVSFPLHAPGKPVGDRVAHWPQVALPVLVLQGTNDTFGGPDELAPHLATLGGPADVHAVEGAGHGFAVPSTRSADGARHEGAEVAATLGAPVAAWLARLDDNP